MCTSFVLIYIRYYGQGLLITSLRNDLHPIVPVAYMIRFISITSKTEDTFKSQKATALPNVIMWF